jgi:hypothetical protein
MKRASHTLSFVKPKPPVKEEKTHAKWAASASDRWIGCPASVALTEKAYEKFGPPEESPAAVEGTMAHSCLEDLFKGRHEPGKYTPEMEKHGRACVSWSRDQWDRDFPFMVENKTKLDFIGDDMGGTLDIAIVEHFGVLHTIDYKFGRHPVSPANNSQLLCYTLAMAHQYDYNFASYRLSIYQPRIERKVPHRSWDCGPDLLGRFAETVARARKLSLKKNPPIKIGSYCYFCPARQICPEQKNKASAKLVEAFND